MHKAVVSIPVPKRKRGKKKGGKGGEERRRKEGGEGRRREEGGREGKWKSGRRETEKMEGKEERTRAGRDKEAGTRHHSSRLALQQKSFLAGCLLSH